MDRPQIVTALRGQRFTLPKMEAIFAGWPADINPLLNWLRLQVDDQLRWILSQRYPAKKAALMLPILQGADFGLFGACWWPRADARALRLMTFFTIWLFLWDDEIDACSGDLSMDLTRAQTYRDETLAFVRHSLGLQDTKLSPKPFNVLIYSFGCIGADLRKTSTIGQRQLLYDEIEIFIQASEVEQRRRLSSDVPSIKEYLECRMGTSAVGCVVAIFEACQDIQLPQQLANSPDMKTIWDSTNMLVSIVNDIVSLKKEIADGPTDNLIPLLWLSTRDLDTALAEATRMLAEVKQEFDEAATRLYEQLKPDTYEYTQLEELVQGCEFFSTGNLFWSLRTGRYMEDRNGEDVIVLS